jgi:hypothetical protein
MRNTGFPRYSKVCIISRERTLRETPRMVLVDFNWTHYHLAQPLDGTTVFYDALWNVPLNEGTVNLVTFGTDTTLRTAPGWDDVTGRGVPNPKPFADFFKP